MSIETARNAVTRTPYGMLAIMWLVGWTLRVPILTAPPLAINIADSFGLGEAGIGALTMLPVVAVAFGAIPAAWIITKFGLRTAIVGGLICAAAASMGRGQAPSAELLFFASVVMGFGIAVCQTALPLATRAWTPTHLALSSTVYLNGMMAGELSAAGLTRPIVLPLANFDWRIALLLWSIPIITVAILVLLSRPANTESSPNSTGKKELFPEPSIPSLGDGRVWQYGILLGSSVVAFFIINAYSASVLQARGESEALSALLLAYNSTPLLASLCLLLVPHWIGKRAPLAIFAVAAVIGLSGFIFFEGWLSWISALIVGYSATVKTILLVSLPPRIASGTAVTRLSAGMTLIGFSLAFLIPLLGGWMADITGSVKMALYPALAFLIIALSSLGRRPTYPNYK
ncbi:MFS transporter [Halomonas desiderata]|uniref:MFS transporter n=1 Tax=Billgrantia desiderata TaxID=52021 RepID=A0ABS9B9X5_9GAMM|nr:MFS transporter [Halomonas desiderata]MCE8044366.1 MFS transporter [Halomonas desiderata]MCE8048940.1 MFS transporter [Halomonas desiderata]NIC37838.1 MFS transporter [Halomonas desiderata]